MMKKMDPNRRSRPHEASPTPPVSVGHDNSSARWNRWWRRVVSVCLVYHIAAMFVSPWSVPPTSRFVMALQPYFAHYQTLMYLNHGYRFFAPDPAPAAVMVYELKMPNGEIKTGLFPDRDAINRDYPRLMYHRWFMLSESIARLTGDAISEAEFQKYLELEREEAQQLAGQGRAEEASQITRRLADDQLQWDSMLLQRRRLLAPLAKSLLRIHQAQEVSLSLNRRLIPGLEDMRRGARTTDSRWLSPENQMLLGSWTEADFQNVDPAPQESLPQPLEN